MAYVTVFRLFGGRPDMVVALIGFVSNVRAIYRGLLLAWRRSRKLARAISGANRYVTSGIRRWLGVPRTVSLMQAEYDALPVKDPNAEQQLRPRR